MNTDYSLKTDVAYLRVEVLERLENLETRLRTEFYSHAKAYDVQSASVAERLAAIETRVRELESKW